MTASVTAARAWLVDLQVETVRTDAMQAFLKQETIFVEIQTDDGASGLGYTYTIGTGGTAVLAMLQDYLLPSLIGQNADAVEAVWRATYDSTRATAVGAITSLALAAIDTALWDRRCKVVGQPLWIVAGGAKPTVPVYDTEIGWLHLSVDELAAGARKVVDAGARGVKIKIGKPSPAEDAERLRAVREVIGWGRDLMVDANQAFTAVEAMRRTAALEEVGALWFEEPLPADDVAGHERLARSTSVAVAVGESMYSAGQFGEYLGRGAAGIVQPDVARVGGITPWLKIAHAAEVHNVQVCPHFLMELHVSLSAAVPNGRYVEYIPQLRSITHSEITITDGIAQAPSTPGLGIDWNFDALDNLRIA